MSDKVIELGRHLPSVESVVSRLYQHVARIKHITAIVEWDDGSSDVAYDTKDVANMCFEKEVLALKITSLIGDTHEHE